MTSNGCHPSDPSDAIRRIGRAEKYLIVGLEPATCRFELHAQPLSHNCSYSNTLHAGAIRAGWSIDVPLDNIHAIG
jgi:hypothetical protein